MQDRIPLGTYPKWAGRLIRWVLNHRLPKRVTIAFRGRGTDRLGERTRFGLNVRSASHVALYLVYTHPKPKQDRREPLPIVQPIIHEDFVSPSWEQTNNFVETEHDRREA